MGGDALQQLDAIDGDVFHQYMALMGGVTPFWREAHVDRDVGVVRVVRVGPVSRRDLGGVMVVTSVRSVVSCCDPKKRGSSDLHQKSERKARTAGRDP